ncbi:RNA polymerase factor sigma-32 [Colwellia echini]|uniref:Sigma-70 family RNA polymerase sigma factor n=1 Tax=Colwellia echini TaxID=1982103 RepID=A0ABY3N0P3_9GAMM|nr:RNA polymerase factor sigma-32 [Colwellia echini]TYK67071.1 sigma-70 family RNA polymerase sigma factor [Colwellia echini]
MTIQFPTTIKNTGSFESYLTYVNSQPRLDDQEERALFLAYQEENNLDAVQKIILSHLRFVAYIARNYQGYGLPIADLVQEGTVGLMKAVKKFNLEHSVRLSSFAVHYIKSEIQEFIIRNWRLVKAATTKAKRKLFFNLRRLKSKTDWLTETEKANIVEQLGVSESDLNDMEVQLSQPDIFINSSLDNDEEGPSYQVDNLLADKSESLELQVIQDDFHKKALHKVKGVIETLDERSKDIMLNRWLCPDKKTHQFFADKYGVSNERIRQLEEKTLLMIRKELEQKIISTEEKITS